jgi:hypothetical protein
MHAYPFRPRPNAVQHDSYTHDTGNTRVVARTMSCVENFASTFTETLPNILAAC